VEDHEIGWPQVAADHAWNSPPAPDDLRRLPFNVLFDREGRVADVDVRGRQLDEAIGRLIDAPPEDEAAF
jgi:hypothetical protein